MGIVQDKDWQARIDKICVSRARVAREAGLCEMTVHNIFHGKELKTPKHRKRIKTLARIEAAISALEKQRKKLAYNKAY